MKFGFIREHSSHDSFVSLREETAAAVKNRSHRCSICRFIIEESPVSVVAVKISQQCIGNKDIPEVFSKENRRNVLLLIDRIHDIGKFSPGPVAVRIKHGIFDRTEIEESFVCGRKILAGADKVWVFEKVDDLLPFIFDSI